MTHRQRKRARKFARKRGAKAMANLRRRWSVILDVPEADVSRPWWEKPHLRALFHEGMGQR